MNEYKKIINFVIKQARLIKPLAGQIEDIGVKKQWLTEYDSKIEQKFMELVKTFKGDNVIYGEEDHSQFHSMENVWVIDPISHTFSFIHGLPHYTVVATHLKKGEPVFAVAYDPSVDELFLAEKGKGMYLNGEQVEVNKCEKDICFVYDFQSPCKKYLKEQRLNLLSELMDIGRNRIIGSACLTYAYVAVGRAHAAIDMNKDNFTSIAGAFMVKEAGGVVTDFNNNDIDLNTVGLVCSNGVIHNRIIEITKNI